MRGWFGVLARLVLGGVLLYAGAVKLPALESSVTAVRAYQLLPTEVAQVLGYALPIVEVLVGALLVLGLFTRTAAVVGGLLMAAFVAGIASVWIRHIPIECGCFGDGGKIPWSEASAKYPWEIARDVALFGLAAFLAIWPRTPWSLDKVLFGGADAVDVDVEEAEETDVEVRS